MFGWVMFGWVMFGWVDLGYEYSFVIVVTDNFC
jgi:hypothetical protein